MKACFGRLALIGCVVAVLAVPTARGDDPPAAVKKTFEKLLVAIEKNDKDAFVADGTDAVKEGTTQKALDGLNKFLGTRLKKGYKATYLCELKQVEHEIYLWKLAFTDKGDDVIVRIAFKEGKVGGFFLQ